MPQARAFLSYTRRDDEYFRGAITAMHKLIEDTVHVLHGSAALEIVQDRDDFNTGEKWHGRIHKEIDEADLFIPILTPSFFTSRYCREELTRFLEREKQVCRDDLIIPIYFVETPLLDRPELEAADPLAKEIATRVRFDWREHSDRKSNHVSVRRAARDLGKRILAALERSARDRRPAPDRSSPATPGGPGRGGAGSQEVTDLAAVSRRYLDKLGGDAPRKLVLYVGDPPERFGGESTELHRHGVDVLPVRASPEAVHAFFDLQKQFDAVVCWVTQEAEDAAAEDARKARESGIQVDPGQKPNTWSGASIVLRALRARDLAAPLFGYPDRPDSESAARVVSKLVASGPPVPFFGYTDRPNPKRAREIHEAGGEGLAASPGELIEMLLKGVGLSGVGAYASEPGC